MPEKLNIAVVGAGIVGASIAWHLARRGARVKLFDIGPGPASGVTSRAFGWVNLINGSPSTNIASYRLRLEAIDAYRRLATELPDAVSGARRGSLVWEDTAEATQERVREHKAQGAPIEFVDGQTVARWEPSLRVVPECAAFSPDDLAVDPSVLTQAFVRAAAAQGTAMNFASRILCVETVNGRVSGLRTRDGTHPFDRVVLAAGTAIDELTSGLGVDIGVESSPAVLLRYSAPCAFLDRILCGPDIEVRQLDDHSLLAAAGYDGESEEHGPVAIGRRTLDAMKARFAVPAGVEFREAIVGQRPVFADGMPRLGHLPQVGGAYVVVGHPGIILAPLLGRLAAEELLDGQRSLLLPELRTA
jgi:glycine/D-amino acid oxidase-like deaminating enzyme